MFKNSNISSILIYFIPLALITGPLIPDILVTSVCLIFIYGRLAHAICFAFYDHIIYIEIPKIF